MELVAALVLVWFLAAIGVSLVLGAVVRVRDRMESSHRQRRDERSRLVK
jgi:predicted phage tail protein